MLQEQVIPIDFGQGTDTKTDPKAVVAGKMLRLENGVFTNPKRIAKRNGYTALPSTIGSIGSLVDPLLNHNYNEELIAADQNLLISYSPNQSAWLSRGDYVSTELARTTVDQEHSADGYADCAILGNYALYAWSTVKQSNTLEPADPGAVYASVVDLTTGTTLVGPTLITSNESHVRCVLLGGTVLALIYTDINQVFLNLKKVVFTSPGVISFSAPVIISTNFSPRSGDFMPYFECDVVATSTGAGIIYGSNTGVTVSTLDTTGAITHTVVVADANAVGPMYISQHSVSNDFWVYWCDSSSPAAPIISNSVVYAIYSSTLVLVLAKTTVATLASPFYVTNIVSRDASSTQQDVYYSYYVSFFTDTTSVALVSNVGVVGSSTTFANGVMPYSRPFSLTIDSISNTYSVFVYRGGSLNAVDPTPQVQPTFFLVRLTNIPSTGVPLVVARFASGLVNLQSTNRVTVGYTPNVCALSATKFIFSCGVETQEFNADFWELNGGPGGLAGVFAYTYDFSGPNSYVAVNAGELAILNGGVMQAYDGNRVSEFNFHLFPEIQLLTPYHDASGGIELGVHSYIAIYQWVDAQGNQHQSAPSIAKSVTLSGTDNAVQITVTAPFLTQKTGVSVAIYRTKAGGGLTYFLVTDPVFPFIVFPLASSVAVYADILSDTALDGNPQPYASPTNAVIENTAPPPSMRMLAHNNRLWFVDSEEPNTVWYTKSFTQGVGLSPSGFITEEIDPKYGEIAALAEMDDKLVILKSDGGMFVQSGDGVNDVGSGSTLSFPQNVPSDVGCSEMKSVIPTPNGVMFKSPKGVYLLSRSLNVVYIGMEVEQYNSQTITAATMMPGKSQIRFLCSSGLTLVFDYIFNQWSTFTNHTGKSATIWQNLYVYAKTGSSIYQESTSGYNDAGTGYSLLAQTSWLALATIQGFQRVRRLIMLGDFTNGASASHAMQIQAAYDFDPTLSAAISFTFGIASASGKFQYRERLPRQKCDSISLLIQETTTGDSAEYIDFTNISFEAGVKKGVNKLPSSQTVG